MKSACRSGSDELAMRVQRHQYPEARQQRDHRGAAVADQRQRHSNHRQYAAHHAGIDEYIDKEAERDGAARQAGERVLTLHRHVQGAPDEHAVQRQDQELSEQAELFADDGENKVRRSLRQELELRLTAVHVAFAEHAARNDRDLRLDDVITGAEPVGLGVQERQDQLALIIVNEVPPRPGGAAEQRYRYQDDLNLQSGQQHDDEPGGRDQQCRAEIRLRDDHRRGNGYHDSHDHQILEGRRQGTLVHVPGAHHRHRELHDLRGLEAHESDVEPALRSLADMTGDVDHDQQQHADDIGCGREQAQVLRRRELGQRQQRGDRDADVHQVMLDHFPVLPGGAVDHQNADAHDDGEYPGQRTVQPQGTQRAAAGGQRASGSGGREFIEYHGGSVPAQRSWKRPSAPTNNGQSSAPITGASQRPNVVTGLPVAPSTQNSTN